MTSQRVRDMGASSALTGTEKFYADNGSSDVYIISNQNAEYAARHLGIYNVKDYGAVGDNTTDDTVAIQAAIDAALAAGEAAGALAGSIVLFPPGEYACSNLAIAETNCNIIFWGTGVGASQLVFKYATGSALLTFNLFSFTMSEMDIKSGGGLNVTSGLSPSGSGSGSKNSQWTFTNCSFDNFDIAGVLNGESNLCGAEQTFINCKFSNNGNGYLLDNFNALNIQFINCSFEANSFGFNAARGGSVNFFGGGFANNGVDFYIDGAGGNFSMYGTRSEGAGTPVVISGNGTQVSLQDCCLIGGSLDSVDAVTISGSDFRVVMQNCYVGGQISCTASQGLRSGFLKLSGCGISDSAAYHQTGTKVDVFVEGCYQLLDPSSDWIAAFTNETSGGGSHFGTHYTDSILCVDFESFTTIKNGSYVVSGLPAAGTAGAGARAQVTNATVTTFASIVAGGGANVVPVYSDGTNWRIG